MGPADLNLLDSLDLIGVVAFALSGALAAAGRRLDLAAVCVVAVATGLLGGTLRDMAIAAPVFWLDRPGELAACLIAAGAVWALGARPWGGRVSLWLDAIGLAAVGAVGAARAAASGATPLAAATVGVLAAMVGGLIRDGVAGEALQMLGRELYLAAAAAGVLLFVLLRLMQLDPNLAAAAGAALILALRAGALRFGWALPSLAERD
jgi:uncharacterized membrane protein YeiH